MTVSRLLIVALLTLTSLSTTAEVQAQGRGGPPPANAQAAAPIDLTGYWVAVVNEDWRSRMVTPPKGDYRGVPITREALKIVNAWDPAADEASGSQCKSYGAAAIMRVPGRLHITWQDDNTMRVDIDTGTQTRLLRFRPPGATPQGKPSWQGDSAARWERPGRGGGPAAAAASPGGSLTVVTTNLRAGYLRKNGVPYSEAARVTEHFDVASHGTDEQLLVVTTVVDDPRYLLQPFVVSSHFKKERDGSKWDPTPCSSSW